jgi:hypothetical protein
MDTLEVDEDASEEDLLEESPDKGDSMQLVSAYHSNVTKSDLTLHARMIQTLWPPS